MNIDLYYQLDDCLSICRRLSGLLERDRDDFSQCARGELYETYRKNCTIMQEELDKFKNQLLQLREEQLL